MDVMVWQESEAGKCPGCDDVLSETTDRVNEDVYEGHVVRCFKCAAKERAHTDFVSQEGSSNAGLLTYSTGGPEITTS